MKTRNKIFIILIALLFCFCSIPILVGGILLLSEYIDPTSIKMNKLEDGIELNESWSIKYLSNNATAWDGEDMAVFLNHKNGFSVQVAVVKSTDYDDKTYSYFETSKGNYFVLKRLGQGSSDVYYFSLYELGENRATALVLDQNGCYVPTLNNGTFTIYEPAYLSKECLGGFGKTPVFTLDI